MLTALKIVIVTVIILVFIVFSVDFCSFIFYRYCRFHIGRWKSYLEWKKAVTNRAIKWLKYTPVVKKTDNSRYLLLDMINKNYKSQSIQSWQKASLILGLNKYDKQVVKECINKFFNDSGEWKIKPNTVDFAMLSYTALKCSENAEKIKPAMDEMIQLIEENMDENGIVSYTGGASNRDRYVDTIGLVCPFLALYAKKYGITKYEDISYNQIKFYHDYGLYKTTNLPNHAIDCDSKLPLGVYGWGRGSVWYVLGLVDTYYELVNKDFVIQLEKWIFECAESYKDFQKQDGGYGSIIQKKNTYDSSATAGMAYFFKEVSKIFDNPQYEEISSKCIKCIQKSTRITGAIDWCQGDTKGIGVFAQTYDIMPFAQGLIIRTIYD